MAYKCLDFKLITIFKGNTELVKGRRIAYAGCKEGKEVTAGTFAAYYNVVGVYIIFPALSKIKSIAEYTSLSCSGKGACGA